jgi:hypothetical protein
LHLTFFQYSDKIIEGGIVRKTTLQTLLYINAYDAEVALDVTALQIKDVWECVE